MKKKRKKLLSVFLMGLMIFSLLPVTAFAENVESVSNVKEHTHSEDCYLFETNCTHIHDETCYPDEYVSDSATAILEEDEMELTECAHVCSEESSCITKKLNCINVGLINARSCYRHIGTWTINENNEFERTCEVCGECEISVEPDFMLDLEYMETEDEISEELDYLLERGIIDQLCYEKLSSIFLNSAGDPIEDNRTYEFTDEVKPIIVESGSPTIILEDVTITATYHPAIWIKTGATVDLEINGENILHGGKVFAGISVEPGATLNILGAGELTVYGGGGSAGIGGDLGKQLGNNMPAEKVNFGTIHFTEDFSGTVNAYGGQYEYFAYHGAAAIGTGSVKVYNNGYINTTHRMSGIIIIDNGTVNAYSYRTGDEYDDNIDNGNGAAIGSGSWTVPYMPSDVKITINGGDINAVGRGDGAGIGAGGNTGVGKISINGGNVVAIGGEYRAAGIGTCYLQEFPLDVYVGEISINGGNIRAEGGEWGAGIGSGVRGESTEIFIGGSAKVNAKGGDYAPGIGPGLAGMSSSIKISDQAKVIATGGAYAAGIGTANQSEEADIEISEEAQVYAYGQTSANAIGESYKGGSASLTLSDTITLWAQNGNTEKSALPANTEYVKESKNGGIYLTTYTSDIDSANKASGRLTDDSVTDDNGISVDWEYKPSQYITLDNSTDVDTGMEQESIPGNWATLYSPQTTESECGSLTVSKTVSGSGASTSKAFTFTVTLGDKTVNGSYRDMTFKDGVATFTLKAGEDKTANDLPAGIGYTVEESDNAGYTVTVNGTNDTMATGTIVANGTSTAAFNNYKASASSGGDGGTTYYHVYYKGNGNTDGTEPKDSKNYSRGDTVTVKKKGTLEKDGYVFVGWNTEKDGSGTNYDLEDTFKIKKDTYLYAQWKKEAAEKPDNNGNAEVPALNKKDHFAYMAGYPEGTFLQERNMTRAEVTAMFSRLITESMTENKAYSNSFNDVTVDKWYYNQIGYMEQFGIIKGYPDGSFRPDAPITRAEFATIAAKFDELKETGNTNFTDLTDAHWAKKFIEMAYHRGWISGYPDGTVKPDRYISRAEVVSVTNRMLERAGDQVYIDNNHDLIKNYIDITNSHWAYYDVMEASNGHLYEKDNTEVWTEVQKY